MAKELGIKRFMHDIRHRRDRYRQFIGISFIFLVTAAGQMIVFLIVLLLIRDSMTKPKHAEGPTE